MTLAQLFVPLGFKPLYQVFARRETIVIRLAATRENIYRRLDAMKRKP